MEGDRSTTPFESAPSVSRTAESDSSLSATPTPSMRQLSRSTGFCFSAMHAAEKISELIAKASLSRRFHRLEDLLVLLNWTNSKTVWERLVTRSIVWQVPAQFVCPDIRRITLEVVIEPGNQYAEINGIVPLLKTQIRDRLLRKGI